MLDPAGSHSMDVNAARRSHRCHSEPPPIDINIHPAGSLPPTAFKPLPPASGTPSFNQLSQATQELAERAAQEVRAFAASRLEAFVAEHRKIMQDALRSGLLSSAVSQKSPSEAPSTGNKRPGKRNSFLEVGSPVRSSRGRKQGSRGSSGRSSSWSSDSIEERHSGSEYNAGKQVRSHSPSSHSSKQLEGDDLPGSIGVVPHEPSKPSESGKRKKKPTKEEQRHSQKTQGRRSKMSDHSSMSCTASLHDLERAVAMRLVESQGLTVETQARKSNPMLGQNGERLGRQGSSIGGGLSSVQNSTGTATYSGRDTRNSSADRVREGGSTHTAVEPRRNSKEADAKHVCPLQIEVRESDKISPTGSEDSTGKEQPRPAPETPRSVRPADTAWLQPPPRSPSNGRRFSVSRFFLAGMEHIRRMSLASGVSPIPEASLETSSARSLRGSIELVPGEDWEEPHHSDTTTSLRRAQDALLARQALVPEEDEEDNFSGQEVGFSCVVLLWLRIWGIFPCVVKLPCKMLKSARLLFLRSFAAHWNQLLMLLLSLAVVGYRCWALVQPGTQFHHVSDCVLAVGSFLCIASTYCIHKCDLFDMNEGVWLRYAQKRCFVRNWQRQSVRHLVEVVVGWLCTVASRVLLGGVEAWPGLADGRLSAQSSSLLDVGAFAFTSGIFFSTIFCVLHFVNALVQGVDSFGRTFQRNQDFQRSVQDWNVLQALLRQASLALENGILVLLTTVMLMLFMCAVDVILGRITGTLLDGLLPRLAPTFVLAVAAGHVLVHCAGVTGRCGRVSPFVTSTLACSKDSEEISQRLVLVQYIDSSAAGFYIREVLVTAADALKVMYLGGMIMVTMVTKAATPD